MGKKRDLKKESKRAAARIEKRLYINVETSETDGGESSPFDNGPYSGFSHTIIDIVGHGPAYYSSDGRGYTSHSVDKIDPDVDWDKLEECTIYFASCRYDDGGTFGRTDGYFDLLYASPSRENVEQWIKDNEPTVKNRHSGYFETYHGTDWDSVPFSDNPENVSKKKWFVG